MAGEGYKVNGLWNWYHFNNRQLTKYDSKESGVKCKHLNFDGW